MRRFPWWVYLLVLLCVCGGIASIFNPPKSTTQTNNSAIVVTAPTATVVPTTEVAQLPATIVIEAGVPAQAVIPDVKVQATQPAPPTEPATIVLEPTEPEVALTAGKVTRVVDGDTLDIDIGGTVSRVRIIGVDTPETVDPRQPVMCYGKEASAETKRLVDLASKNVLLEKDISETDRYGRLLRYVWLEHPDGRRMLNLELVKGGFAQVSTYPPDVKYVDMLLQARREARQSSAGLWGACAAFGVPAAPAAPVVMPTSALAAKPKAPTATTKPVSSGLKYDPFGPDRDCGDFDTYQEAYAFFKAAGGPTSDRHRLDGDHDGIPCQSLPGAP